MAMVSYKCRPYIQLLFYFSSDRFYVVLVDELVTIACKNINTVFNLFVLSYITIKNAFVFFNEKYIPQVGAKIKN